MMPNGGDEMIEPTRRDSVTERRPRGRGDRELNRLLAHVARTMAEMELGRCTPTTLDTMASPLAARRIHKQVQAAQEGPARRRTEPVRTLSATSMHPTAGVAEGVVVVQIAERVRAFCVRLEQEGDRWRLVDLASPETDLRAAVTEASRRGAVPLDDQGVRRSSGGKGAPFSVPPLPTDPVLRIEEED